jgi:hypothetical protein
VVSALADINIEQNTNTELYVASYFEDVDKDDELMLSISVLGRENLPGGLEFDDVANIVSINSLIEIPSFDIVLTASDMGGLTASDTIRVEVDVVTGIEEEFSKLSVFPNPTERTLYLSNPYAMNLNSSQLTIINLNGSDQTKNATFYYNEIDVSNLKKGVYFLKIIEQDKTRYIRFVRK